MPRVIYLRLGFLWLGATMNDYGEIGKPRFGVTQRQAQRRVCNHIDG